MQWGILQTASKNFSGGINYCATKSKNVPAPELFWEYPHSTPTIQFVKCNIFTEPNLRLLLLWLSSSVWVLGFGAQTIIGSRSSTSFDRDGDQAPASSSSGIQPTSISQKLSCS